MLDYAAKWVALTLIVLSLASPFLARESSSSFQRCQSEHEANTPGQEQNLSIFIERVIARRCTAEFVHTHSPELNAVAAVMLTLVTVGLLWVGYMQIVTTRGQLRAYVFAGECTIGFDGENNPIAIVRVLNTGASPAYKMIVVSSAKTFWAREVRRFERPKRAERTSQMDLGAKIEALNTVSLKAILNANGLQALKSGELELYVWGIIRYADTFGRRQRTEFRFVLGGPHKWPDDNRFVVTPDGNRAS
jgi:hypothetical protein